MDPHIAAAAVLVLCLMLVVMTSFLGVEVGKAAALPPHPGYSPAA